MADAVDSKVLRNGPNFYTIHLQNNSDGTGESAVTKVDISTLTVGHNPPATCTWTSVYAIQGEVWGGEVQLLWDHTTDDEIVLLSGFVDYDWSYEGGNVDPKTAGGTGDILLTTNGFTASSGYDLTLRIRKKA